MSRYTVTAERGAGDVWVFQCVEHPGAISQARRLDQAETLMREAIAWVAGVPESEVDVDVHAQLTPETQVEIERVRQLREESARMQAESSEAMRRVAHDLHDEGLTVRDIGTVLDVSYQRAHQLVS